MCYFIGFDSTPHGSWLMETLSYLDARLVQGNACNLAENLLQHTVNIANAKKRSMESVLTVGCSVCLHTKAQIPDDARCFRQVGRSSMANCGAVTIPKHQIWC